MILFKYPSKKSKQKFGEFEYCGSSDVVNKLYIRPSHCYLPPRFSELLTALKCRPSVSMVLFEKNNQPADYFSVHFIKSLEFFQSWQGSLFFVTKMHAQCKSLQQRVLYCNSYLEHTDYGHPMKGKIKETWKFRPMWQTKYAAAIPKNLGVGVNFRPCSEGYFLSGCP